MEKTKVSNASIKGFHATPDEGQRRSPGLKSPQRFPQNTEPTTKNPGMVKKRLCRSKHSHPFSTSFQRNFSTPFFHNFLRRTKKMTFFLILCFLEGLF